MQQFVFDTLWNRAIAAELKINEMEEQKVGQFVTARTEIIQNPQITQELFIDMIKSAEKEILLIIPTINAFLREERLGIIKLLKNVAIRSDINIKILSPINDFVDKIMQSIEEVQGKRANYFDLRPVEQTYEEMTVTTVTIIIVDKKASLVIEKLDDSQENFIDATGSSTYSNSKPTVSSYISIFESLWARAKLYEQLKKHNKMQQEFINVAAHELRTPTQSILGYAELLKANIQDTEPTNQAFATNQAFVDIIYRNAARLHGLTTDILDVTRIESQTLKLNKRRFNLKDVIINAIDDIQGNPVVNRNNVKIFYKPINGKDETIFVDADMDRITQVITNLLDNALKFTSAQGYVSVTLERKDKQEGLGEEEVVVVDVEDTGSGIEPEIFPRLFTKFVSKSFEGTGLGLYISKSLIEAHGGRISAKNNDRKKCGGATFSFTLPLVKLDDI
jgi:K+-sensing histidine kinase KdpD